MDVWERIKRLLSPPHYGVSRESPHVLEHLSPYASEHHAPSIFDHHASSLEKNVNICPAEDQVHQGSFQLSEGWDHQ